MNEHAPVERHDHAVGVGDHAENGGGGGIATSGSVVCLQDGPGGVHLFHHRAAFHGEEEGGGTGRVRGNRHVQHVVADVQRRQPRSATDVVA